MTYDWDGVRTRRIRRAKWAAFLSTLAMAAFFLQNVVHFG
jgi:hypothetical protein